MAIDPSLCDYGRKNETAIREVDRLTVDDASRLRQFIDEAARDDENACRTCLLIAVAAFGGVSIYAVLANLTHRVWKMSEVAMALFCGKGVHAVLAHLVRCVWIIVERQRRIKSPTSSRRRHRHPDPDGGIVVDRLTTHKEESMRSQRKPCNGDLPADKGTPDPHGDRTSTSKKSPVEDCADRQSKILSVTNCFQNAQITL